MAEEKKQWKMTRLEKDGIKLLREKEMGYQLILDDLALLRSNLVKAHMDWWAAFKKNHNISDEDALRLLANLVKGIVKVAEDTEGVFSRLSDKRV